MKKTFAIATLAAATLMGAVSFASAQDLPSVEDTYKDIEATFGVVPGHFKSYPPTGVAGAWAMTKGLVVDPANKLEPKVKSLIGLAVAAQIPCQYCIWLETKFAKVAGATDEEVAEAVAQAAYVRHWSTYLNGMQVDFETFKTEFGGD
ncbi:MAG: carboxymuconolactone decarboxylase family protein [Hoeflea sp.]|uniref:carboxymuconolactone decarboxylase family protein n=1 Tax=Hoeflea sp. TaxID=1940281 RepID=UPI001DD45336|nr:carboxymuconolactone decarboxylase family protein [Hoeflea sp.]MBU4530320.1 carboxymuconolactone decarboxylase family protein [Alphaproteobacteria bacterium]MBU4545107.1 carboxymuconolactone decarboxylase family protein [Alphaproteobacteria bacterium]MBU4549693.1 carboxymuconolactone decarboxylase family protein [Alphaproteobacteria bacterium]MBV1721910.1 carboxymuconolactone decarboxylase family protein [Hoeflea sp.]MBV1761260.1 carboxymuconolactone decarboxylase family protein [Hoeflea sp